MGLLNSIFWKLKGEVKSSGVIKSSLLGTGLGAAAGAAGAFAKKIYHKIHAKNCTHLESVSNFSLDTFISAPWYPQWQNEQSNRHESSMMNCSSATFSKKAESFWGWGLNMDFEGFHEKSVLEEEFTERGFLAEHTKRCAYQQEGGYLKYGVCSMPRTMGSPFWVIYYNETLGATIMVGGQPNNFNETTGKCSFLDPIWNNMVIFTRERVPSDTSYINSLKTYMSDDLELDTSNMFQVPQTGCDAMRKRKNTDSS